MSRHPTQPRRLLNAKCLYCAEQFSAEKPKTKEHVIGRRFVPTGALYQCWNLIVNACARCNNLKADLENDLSVITMLPPLGEQLSPELANEAQRRARRSSSRRTRRPVADSQETMEIKIAAAPNAIFTFNMVAPPQADSSRVNLLSLMHMQAFFYMITYSYETRLGGYWLGKFDVTDSARRPDWGNPRQRAFAASVEAWPHRLIVNTANGHFKAMIRRKPNAEVWAWALEWNKGLRNVGYFGEEESLRSELARLPEMHMQEIRNDNGNMVRFRVEESLSEENDALFNIDRG